MKRRDNAPIVKDIYGGLIDILMEERNPMRAVEFVRQRLQDVRQGRVPIEKLIITKSLRSGYKNPLQIAHKVLAERIGRRDQGNKPKPGDRVKFVYIQTNTKCLQGERIETPEYIKEKGLLPDYEHYITNQLMKPIEQVIELILDEIPGYDSSKIIKDMEKWKDLNEEKQEEKREKLRLKEVTKLL